MTVSLPVDVRLELPWVSVFALSVPDSKVPVFSVKFVGQDKSDEMTTFPVVLLPMVSRLAVIWPSSVEVRPRLEESSAPPRLTPAPSVWISTSPAAVASKVPVSEILLAVTVIRPPLE